MKRRMRKLWGLLMAFTLTAGLASNVNAVTLNDAQQKAEELFITDDEADPLSRNI